MTTETTNYVDYFDLEHFVKERYGHAIEIVAMEECSNDTSLTYYVSKTSTNYQKLEREAWVEHGEFYPFGTGEILNQLCVDGYIAEGSYVIRISW